MPRIASTGALVPGTEPPGRPMKAALALLPSPLLGPAVWQPAAEELARRGWTTIVPPVPPDAPASPHDVLGHFVAALPTDRDVILVPHSNAGLYLPVLTTVRPVVGFVFVDAGLPGPDGEVPLAPPVFLDLLRQRADPTGLLPPWTSWWAEADTAPLFPDPATRQRIEREQHRLPLSYFTGSLPVPAGWDAHPGGYLAFGDTYDDERRAAGRRGWPVRTMPGRHLHTLVDPPGVAAEISALLADLGLGEPHRP